MLGQSEFSKRQDNFSQRRKGEKAESRKENTDIHDNFERLALSSTLCAPGFLFFAPLREISPDNSQMAHYQNGEAD